MIVPASRSSQQDHSFEFEGQRYTLELDMAAIAAFEQVSGISVILFLMESQAGIPKVSHICWLLQAALKKHHPELTADDCLRMLSTDGVKAQLDIALDIAMPPPSASGADEPGE